MTVTIVSLLKWLMVAFSLLGVCLIVFEVLVTIVVFAMGVIVLLVKILGLLETVFSLTMRFVVKKMGVAVISMVVVLISLV